MSGLIVALAVLSAPPPVTANAPPPISLKEAGRFSSQVADLAERIRAAYFRPVGYDALALAAARGLYRAAGERIPAATEAEARKLTGKAELAAFLASVRFELGNRPMLADPRDYLAAVAGFTDALDPYCGLVLDSAGGSIGRSGIEAVLGVEFAGVSNAWWVGQHVEPERVPGGFTGVVGRVAAGGFAARNGVRPGDRLVSVNGIPLEPRGFVEVARGIRSSHTSFVYGRIEDEARSPPKVPVIYERDGVSRATTFHLDHDPDRTESIVGVRRTEKGAWSHLLPAPPDGPKFGFIRLGPLDYGSAAQLNEALDQLKQESAAGVVLDLRGCPGGYINEAALIAERFVPAGRVLYSTKSTSKELNEAAAVKSSTGNPGAYGRTVPLVLLVDQTTQGGGELIVAAIRDSKRGVLAGGRTFGKGLILSTVPTSYQGMSFRVSSGVCLRPDGTDRHRYPESKPNDTWGVRPDPGLEFGTSREFAERINGWYDLHVIRLKSSTDALPLDDPLNDPVLQFATRKLGELVRNKVGKQ